MPWYDRLQVSQPSEQRLREVDPYYAFLRDQAMKARQDEAAQRAANPYGRAPYELGGTQQYTNVGNWDREQTMARGGRPEVGPYGNIPQDRPDFIPWGVRAPIGQQGLPPLYELIQRYSRGMAPVTAADMEADWGA